MITGPLVSESKIQMCITDRPNESHDLVIASCEFDPRFIALLSVSVE